MAIISAANPFDEEGILEALSTLAKSSNVAFQLSAATAYEKTSIQDVEKVDSKTLRPLIPLLRSTRVDVQTMALVALTKFAENNDNSRLIVQIGALVPLIAIMISSNAEMQALACSCLLCLSSQDSNKKVIASSGALVPLLQLIKSSDIKVQLLVLDTIAELVTLEENQKPMIDAGAIPIMVDCLKASNRDVRIGSGEILCQLAPDSRHVRDLFVLSADIVDSAIELSDCDNLLKKRFAARSFFNLGHDKKYQDEIVRRGGLTSLQKLLLSTDIIVVLLSLTCVNEMSANSKHQTRLIDGDFIERLIELVAWKDTEEIQVLATSTLFRISNQSELGKAALVDARIAERIRSLVLSASPDAQTLMACVISTISDSVMLRARLIQQGALDIFVYCTTSSLERSRRYGFDALNKLLVVYLSDLQPFVNIWEAPAGGIHGLLSRSLDDADKKTVKRALGMITMILKCNNQQLRKLLIDSTELKTKIRRVGQVKGNAIPPTPTWTQKDLFNDGLFCIKAAKLNIRMMHGREP